jgi:hypothetical protein
MGKKKLSPSQDEKGKEQTSEREEIFKLILSDLFISIG